MRGLVSRGLKQFSGSKLLRRCLLKWRIDKLLGLAFLSHLTASKIALTPGNQLGFYVSEGFIRAS